MRYQDRVAHWLLKCFGNEADRNKQERSYRFLEEALELAQSLNVTESEATQLVKYVFSRPKGKVKQEVGGVMMTLAALCFVQGIHMKDVGEIELARCWEDIETIRKKQAAKDINSSLPGQVG